MQLGVGQQTSLSGNGLLIDGHSIVLDERVGGPVDQFDARLDGGPTLARRSDSALDHLRCLVFVELECVSLVVLKLEKLQGQDGLLGHLDDGPAGVSQTNVVLGLEVLSDSLSAAILESQLVG